MTAVTPLKPAPPESASRAPPPVASALELIGRTPVIEVTHAFDTGPCRLFIKLESSNPGGSIKDRIALTMIEAAEKDGRLKPGGTIVEATAGNTGLGLAQVGILKGYKLVLVVPDKMAREKILNLRAMNVDVRLTRSDVGKGHPEYYQDMAQTLAQSIPGAIYVNQFENPANPDAHEKTTAPEIWAQLEGRIDGFTCAAGTGGTLAGVGMGLKAFDEDVTIALTDPYGAALYNYYAHGELKAEGSSVAEGIGQGRITANLDGAPVDTQFRVSDEEGIAWVRRLLSEEGLCLGLSSGINVAGAVELGRRLVAEGRGGPDRPVRVATILCDTGFRYLSSLYNRAWLEAKGLPVFPWLAA